jgi:hypothetical protein
MGLQVHFHEIEADSQPLLMSNGSQQYHQLRARDQVVQVQKLPDFFLHCELAWCCFPLFFVQAAAICTQGPGEKVYLIYLPISERNDTPIAAGAGRELPLSRLALALETTARGLNLLLRLLIHLKKSRLYTSLL